MAYTGFIRIPPLYPIHEIPMRSISKNPALQFFLLCVVTSVTYVAVSICPASAQTTITFPQGKTAAGWSGFVKQDHVFKVFGKQGQRIYVEGGDLYTYAITAPSGRVLNCDMVPYDKEVCELQRSRLLPETGVYTVHVLYRMGGYPGGREVSTLITVRDD